MRTVIYNARIYQEKDRFVQALLIEDGIIIRTGSDEEVLMEAENARLIDAGKRLVVPGFNDSHMHLFNFGKTLFQCDLSRLKSKEDLVERALRYKKEYPDRCAKAVFARGWSEDGFADPKDLPTCFDLDKIADDIPVLFQRVCGHYAVANSFLLKQMGIEKGSRQTEGGLYYTFEDGSPNGMLSEKRVNQALALLPQYSREEMKEIFLKAMDACVSYGLTSVQSNDIDDFEKQTEMRLALEELYEEQKAPLKYRLQSGFKDLESFERVLKEKKYGFEENDPWLKAGPLKLYKDGSLGARTALLKEEYSDDPGNCGICVMSREEMDKWVALANGYKMQAVIHAIGDRALEEVSDSLQEAGKGGNPYRNGIIHVQISDHEQLKKMEERKQLAFIQPVFLEYDIHMIKDRVGEKRARESYGFHTFQGHKSLGTDCPVESCNPFLNLHCAINRTDYDDFPEGGYQPEEKMSVSEALDGYTCESAYAEFAEARKGRLKEGYDADLVICDRDIFRIDSRDIKKTKPVLVMVDGYVVYEE